MVVCKGCFYDGKVMVMCLNLCWCLDGLEFICWNGEVICFVFIIDVFDCEIIVWMVVVNVGIFGFDVCDMMLEVVEKCFVVI